MRLSEGDDDADAAAADEDVSDYRLFALPRSASCSFTAFSTNLQGGKVLHLDLDYGLFDREQCCGGCQNIIPIPYCYGRL